VHLAILESLILILIEDRAAILYPASSKMLLVKSTTVDLPEVPVTPITFIFLEGKEKNRAEKKAHKKWYKFER